MIIARLENVSPATEIFTQEIEAIIDKTSVNCITEKCFTFEIIRKNDLLATTLDSLLRRRNTLWGFFDYSL